LTDLPNRRFFIERLDQAIKLAKREQQKLAVLFMDLDHFKPINDDYGHAVGDQFLCGVAQAIKQQLREGDTLSRFGGDEFVVLLSSVQSAESAESWANKLLQNLNATQLQIEGHELTVSASIGGAVYPDRGEEANSLIQSADEAMYAIKNTTRNAVKFI
jgi:diguanylate cyclase (GGDEF)-like protein